MCRLAPAKAASDGSRRRDPLVAARDVCGGASTSNRGALLAPLRLRDIRVPKPAKSAGFEFVDYSSLHYRPDDSLEYEVGRKTVTGNTDRFTLLFRKP